MNPLPTSKEALDLVQHVPLPVYVFRVSGKDFVLESVNPAAERNNPGILSLIGRPLQGLYQHQPEAIADAERCATERTTVVREMPVRRYDRTEATQLVRLTYVPIEDRMVLFMEDVATPAIQESALRESEARYRSLVSSLPDAVLLRGADRRVLACNDVAVRLFGAKSQADLLGMEVFAPTAQVFTEDGHPIAPSDFPSLRVIETGQPELGRVFLLVAEGRRRWLRVSSEPIPSSTGGVAGSVTIYSDVTANRELEEELRRAHRLESIGRLAGGIAHDFNNLLAAILGSVELLQDRIPTAAVEDVATIRHAAERARDLTRQLLAFARKQPARLEAVDLATITGTVEPMLRRLVGPKIEMLVKRAEPAVVRADPSLLEQVLVNLVVNAKEAMPDGGRVEIRVGRRTGSTELPGATDVAELEVADSGVGMDEATRGQVFDPFFTTKELGTGLGLASSYGIIQQHGGNILVESEPARGTRFRVLLPLLSDP